MKHKKLTSLVALSAIVATSIAPTYASSSVKYLEAHYNNIRVMLNDQYKDTSIEPFIVDGTTYVGLRDLATIFNIDAEWDGANQLVILEGSWTADMERYYELELFTNRLYIAELEEKIAQYEYILNNPVIEDAKAENILSNLESALESYFLEDYGIEWEFVLTQKSSYIDLLVQFDGRDFLDTYDDLRTSEIRSFLTDVCEYIMDELEDTELEGMIIKGDVYDYDDKEILTSFVYENDSLSFSQYVSTYLLSALAEDIYDDIIIDEYDEELPELLTNRGYRFWMDVVDLYIEEDDDFYTFTVEVDVSRYASYWNDIDEDEVYYDLRDFMEDIGSEIATAYSLSLRYDIAGYIIDEDSGDILLEYENRDLTFETISE